MITFITVMMALLDLATSGSRVDNLGHLGGFFTGALIAPLFTPILNTSMRRHVMPGMTYEKYVKIGGGVLSALWFGIGIAMLYTQRHPAILCRGVLGPLREYA